jgi:hypothetical protein
MIGPPVIAQYTAAPAPTPAPQLINVGQNQMLIQRPAGAAKGIVILIPGGTTNLFISPNGFIRDRETFAVRSRDAFAAAGYATILITNTDIIPQAVSQSESIAGPVFLVGVANAGGPMLNYVFNKKPDPRVAGLVFVPPVSQFGANFSVQNYPIAKLKMPVLLVQNRQDACPLSLPNNAISLATDFGNATLQWQNSFEVAGSACDGLSPHGFLSIEDPTVRGIAKWMASVTK